MILLGHSALVLSVAKASALLKAPESCGVCRGRVRHERKRVVLALHHTPFSSLTRASAAIGSLGLVRCLIQHRRWVRTRQVIPAILRTGCQEEMCCAVRVWSFEVAKDVGYEDQLQLLRTFDIFTYIAGKGCDKIYN